MKNIFQYHKNINVSKVGMFMAGLGRGEQYQPNLIFLIIGSSLGHLIKAKSEPEWKMGFYKMPSHDYPMS